MGKGNVNDENDYHRHHYCDGKGKRPHNRTILIFPQKCI